MALNTAALAGDILLESGAEISRVEETINRIARAYGIESFCLKQWILSHC